MLHGRWRLSWDVLWLTCFSSEAWYLFKGFNKVCVTLLTPKAALFILQHIKYEWLRREHKKWLWMKSSNIQWLTYSMCESVSTYRTTLSDIWWTFDKDDKDEWVPCETHAAFFVCSCVLPVCVRSNLFNNWLGPLEELVHIGHIEEEILHVHRRGRGFPWLKHTAALY